MANDTKNENTEDEPTRDYLGKRSGDDLVMYLKTYAGFLQVLVATKTEDGNILVNTAIPCPVTVVMDCIDETLRILDEQPKT